MAVIVIDSGAFCRGPEVSAGVRRHLHSEQLTDEMLFMRANERFGIDPRRLERFVYGSRSVLDHLRRDQVQLVAGLRACVAEAVARDGHVYLGRAGHLVPPSLTHVLKVCLGGTHEYRVEQAVAEGLSRRDAERRIAQDDESRAEWTGLLFDRSPWDKTLYDVFLAMQETTVDEAVDHVVSHASTAAVAFTPAVEQAVRDFQTAAEVGVAVADEGHDVEVACVDGSVTLLLKRHTLFLERHQRELEKIALGVDGVTSAVSRPGPRYHEPSMSFDLELNVPSKVLLVDDEQEFVHALSERLQSRSIQSAIAYDGEQALAMVANDEPEVIVLDLKMPGIDGLEVLRRVKQTNPATEVIILTGHGSAAEEVIAADLGAFAYLRKPVDIDQLTRTMKEAYRKIEEARADEAED
jgi:two-component system response regulator CpxR